MSRIEELKTIISAHCKRADDLTIVLHMITFEKPAAVERYVADGWRVTLSLYRPLGADGGWVVRKAVGQGKHDRDVRAIRLDDDSRSLCGGSPSANFHSNKALDQLFVARQRAIDAEIAKARKGE